MVVRVKHWPFMACIEWIREGCKRPSVHGYPFENKIQTAIKIKAASVLTK
jgi:hypothetical protein